MYENPGGHGPPLNPAADTHGFRADYIVLFSLYCEVKEYCSKIKFFIFCFGFKQQNLKFIFVAIIY